MQSQVFEFGGFHLEAAKRLLKRGDGTIVPLTPKVFDTLLFLVENGGRVVEKEELMSTIWPDTVVEENNLSQNISILRRLLGENRGENRFISTIPGRGFKFVADVRMIDDNEAFEPSTAPESLPADLGAWDMPSRESIDADKIKSSGQPSLLPVLAGIAFIIIAVSAFYYWRSSQVESPVKSIAVLPFKPLVAENRDEALEIGMADTLIARLANSRDIIVRPLSSVRRFGGLDQDPQRAGADLQVGSVLDGSIQRWGDKIRVNVRLIGTADGATLWSETFDEKFTDIFVVQDAISQKIVSALVPRLSNEEKKRLSGRATENVEAYRLYLQGRYHALKSTPPEIRQGIEFYQKAIAADPLYALAFAGMAQAYSALPITSDVKPNEAFPQAKAAAQRALEIDENLAEAHIVLGVVEFWFEWDWANSEAEMKKAIAFSPNSPDAHRFYAVLLTALGRSDEALLEMETARQLDPLSLIVNSLKGQIFFYAERDAEAINQLQKTFEIDPNFWIAHLMLARVFIRQNRFDEAIAEAKKAEQFSGGNSEAVSLGSYALAKSGRRDEAVALLEELKSRSIHRYIPAYNIALIYNGLDEREQSLVQLEKAFKDRDARMILLKVEPKWDNLRTEPRFVDLIKRMRFE